MRDVCQLSIELTYVLADAFTVAENNYEQRRNSRCQPVAGDFGIFYGN